MEVIQIAKKFHVALSDGNLTQTSQFRRSPVNTNDGKENI
jgi:hypothetical protein